MTTVTTLPKNSSRREGMPLFRWLLRKNLPWMGLFFALCFLVQPLQYIIAIFGGEPVYYRHITVAEGAVFSDAPFTAPGAAAARIYTEQSLILFCFLVAVAAGLIALGQTWWLRSKRSTEFWHGLPVRRDTLLLANAGAAWLTVALPLIANYLITIAAGAVRLALKKEEWDYFVFPVGEILLDLLCWLALTLTITAMVFLVSAATGRLIEMVIFGAVLFLGPPAAALILDLAFQRFLVGWFESGFTTDFYLCSSPLLAMAERYGSYNTFRGTYPAQVNWVLFLWLLLGLCFLWLACRCYRSRPTEQSGSGGVREPLGTFGLLLGVFVTGLGLGLSLWYRFGLRPFALAVLGCALAAALLLMFLLKRGFRGLSKQLPLLALAVVMPVAVAAALTTGGLGYEEYIPAPETASWVKVRYRGRYGVLAERLNHEWENIETVQLYTNDGPVKLTTTPLGETPETEALRKTAPVYFYTNAQQVTLSTPEGLRAAENLHQSLVKTQQMEPEGQRSLGGHIDFAYADGTKRIYGQWLDGMHTYDCWRDVEPLLALEENLEFRQQTDPRFTVTPEEVRAVRVSDVTGLTTGEAVTGREEITRLLAAMKADAEAFDYGSFRDGSARAVAYLSVETTAPAPGEPVREPIGEDRWRDFCLPVYEADSNTRDVLEALGQGELAEPSLNRDKVAKVRVSWWGNASWIREVYWTGTGPRDLLESVREGHSDTIDNSSLVITDRAVVEELLDLSLGADCHISEPGFLVTVLGADRQGSTFWLTKEEAPQAVLDWYTANEKELRSVQNVWVQRMQP